MKTDLRELRIDPEGFIGDEDCLIFRDGMWRCGEAENGMDVRVGVKAAGGVIKNSDLKKLELAIRRHLYAVKKIETSPQQRSRHKETIQ